MTSREAEKRAEKAKARRAYSAAVAKLRAWRTSDAASTVGALSLLRANTHYIGTLKAWGALVAAGVAAGSRKASREVTKALTKDLKAWVGWADDPASTSNTAYMTFYGGDYTFFLEDPLSAFALQRVFETIATLDDSSPELAPLRLQLLATARVSDAIAMRLGTAGYESAERDQGAIQIPRDADLRRLRKAVTFQKDELEGLLDGMGLDLEALDRLVLVPEEFQPIDDKPFDSRVVEERPILRLGDTYIVYAPRCIVRASLHHTWDAVRATGLSERFAHTLHLAARSAIHASLCFLGARPERAPEAQRVATGYLSQTCYAIDVDKVVIIHLISEAPCADVPLGSTWSLDISVDLASKQGLRPLLASRRPCAVQHVVAVLGTTRSIHLESGSLRERQLGLRADELVSIAWSEAFTGDALLLWRFGEEHQRIASRHHFAVHDLADVYAVWRNSRLLVPEMPNGAPASIIIPYGTARDLRELAHRQMNFHGEPDTDPGSTAMVMNIDAEVRGVYAAVGRAGLYVTVLGSVRLWLSNAEGSSSYPTYLLSRALGYWFTLLVQRSQRAAHASAAQYVCSATVHGAAGPFPADGLPYSSDRHFDVTSSGRRIVIVIHDSFWQRVGSSGNDTEIALIGAIMLETLLLSGCSAGDATACVEGLETIAKASPESRMLHSYDTVTMPELIHKEKLPRIRALKNIERDLVRRLIGSNLASKRGEYVDEGATRIINDAVGVIYRELGQLFSALDINSALGKCVEQVEAQLARDTERAMTVQAALACAPSSNAALVRHQAEWAEASNRATASRFLVEFVVGQKSSSRRPMSDLEYEYGLSLAAELVTLGCISDVSHFRIAPVRVRLHEFGFDLDLPEYQTASAIVASLLSTDGIKNGKQAEEVMPNSDEDDLDAAAADEFGFSIRELTMVVAELLNLAETSHASRVELSIPAFVSTLSSALGWPTDRIQALRQLWGLTPRVSFFEGLPRGIRPTDLYPWRMNRAYSYIRRPLVWDVSGNIVFTAGHLSRALRYLIQSCVEGRLNATTQRMRSCMSAQANRRAKASNDRVAQSLHECGYEVWVRVGKFAKAHLLDAKGALGDVDVVALDRSRNEVWAIECKDLSLGRAPHEVYNDLLELFRGTGQARTFQEKLLARVEWMNTHRDKVAEHLGLRDPQRITLRTAFVFSQPMASALLGEAKVPILFEEQLRGRFCLRDVKARPVTQLF